MIQPDPDAVVRVGVAGCRFRLLLLCEAEHFDGGTVAARTSVQSHDGASSKLATTATAPARN